MVVFYSPERIKDNFLRFVFIVLSTYEAFDTSYRTYAGKFQETLKISSRHVYYATHK